MDKAVTVSLLALAAAGAMMVMVAAPAKADTVISATGGKLTFADLLALAQEGGFVGQDSVKAAGIALAESSGDPMALGDSGNSFGLWQIYMPAHPEFAGINLYDPQANVSAAFDVYRTASNSFSPWTTFKNQAYLSRIPSGYLA